MLRHARVVGLFLSILLSLSVAARARERYGQQSSQQIVYQYGYQDGLQTGRDSNAQGVQYNFHTEDFRYADRGYDPSMGEHDDFQKAYRNGYRAGYDDGYYGRGVRYDDNGYGRNDGDPNAYRNDNRDYGYVNQDYGYENRGYRDANRGYGYENRGYGYQNPASDFGYRDGLEQGQKDRYKGKEFRPRKNDRFEDADHGYHKEFGAKNFYKEQYRRAFVRGYEDGYRRY